MSKSVVWTFVFGLGAASLAILGRQPVVGILGDFREYKYWQQADADANKHSAVLQEVYLRSNERLTAKDRITKHMIDGRISVSEAGRQFAGLPDSSPCFMARVRQLEPGKTDHERLCWHLIDYACAGCESESEKRALRRRLTQELEASLRENGGVLSLDRVVAQ
jgi:hypothetical protein